MLCLPALMTWFWVYALFADVHASTHPSIHPLQSMAASSDKQTSCALLQVGKQSTTAGASECDLQFLHIPKNAGTTIENWGKQAGIKWGSNLFSDIIHDDINVSGSLCGAHHVPPSMLNTSSRKPYLGSAEVFCVKRDPYSRLVSEYGYRLQHYLLDDNFQMTLSQLDAEQICPGCDEHIACSASGMNYFLNSILTMIKNKSVPPSIDRCHFLPQVDYIWSGGHQTCKHVLTLENLTDEFEELMASQHCDLPESYKDEIYENPALCESLSTADLEPETKALIQDVYKDDFDKLGFVM